MSRLHFILVLVVSLTAATLVIAGCSGGYTAPTSTSSSGSSGAANPAPTPTPAPAPGSNPDMFQAPMINGPGNKVGQIQVNASANNGAGTLTLQGAPQSASMTLRFQPFDADTYGNGAAPAYDITTVTTDASGNAQVNFQYPKSGVFFGAFRLMQGTTAVADSGYTYTTTPDFHASIQRASTVNDVNWSPVFTVGNDQVTSGSLNVHGSNLTIQVAGAVPNSRYDVSMCPNGEGSGCYQVASFNTDASGAASASADLTGTYTPAGETFYIFRGNALEYVGGFKVQ